MLSIEELFLNTTYDLQEKVKEPDDYKIIRAAGLLRQLLLDGGSSLVIQVNRKYKIKLLFRVSEVEELPAFFVPSFLWTSLYAVHGSPSIFLKLDDFLDTHILTSHGERFTVSDFIKLCAHVFGGVHVGKSSLSEREKKLIDLCKAFLINDKSNVYSHIHSIAMIVLEALQPLIKSVEGNDGFEPRF